MLEYHAAELLAKQPPPIEWLVAGLLPVGTLGDVSGPPGDGKSTILLSLADHISRGAPWFGIATKQTPVAWITGEASSAAAIQRDLHRLHAAPDADIQFLLPEGEMFRFDRQVGSWITTAEGAAILQRCRDADIRFVVIDTIGSVCAGLVEIDNDQQRQLARHLRGELAGMTAICVSHTNQSSAKETLDWRLHYLSRAGGNGFPGAIRWAAGVTSLKPDDVAVLGERVTRDEITQARIVAFGISKHNEMPRPAWNNITPAIFEIKQDGQLVLLADGEAVALHQRQAKAENSRQKNRESNAGGKPKSIDPWEL